MELVSPHGTKVRVRDDVAPKLLANGWTDPNASAAMKRKAGRPKKTDESTDE